jgi:hypothetical protein
MFGAGSDSVGLKADAHSATYPDSVDLFINVWESVADRESAASRRKRLDWPAPNLGSITIDCDKLSIDVSDLATPTPAARRIAADVREILRRERGCGPVDTTVRR